MNHESVEKGFKLVPETKGTFEWNEDSTKVTFNPEASLQKETTYKIIC